MATKPSYLGLLNAIAVGEARGHQLLNAWANNTPNEDLAALLSCIALREHEHAAAFAKRIGELGFAVRQKDDPLFPMRLEAAGSPISDRKKFKTVLGYRKKQKRASKPDVFTRMFDDVSIDIQTGTLLGRFIAEERDSGRQLRAAYGAIACTEETTVEAPDTQPATDCIAGQQGAPRSTPATNDDELDVISARLDALTASIEALKSARQLN